MAKWFKPLLSVTLSLYIIACIRFSHDATLELPIALIFDLAMIIAARWGMFAQKPLGLSSFPIMRVALLCFLTKFLYVAHSPGPRSEVLYWTVGWLWMRVDGDEYFGNLKVSRTGLSTWQCYLGRLD